MSDCYVVLRMSLNPLSGRITGVRVEKVTTDRDAALRYAEAKNNHAKTAEYVVQRQKLEH